MLMASTPRSAISRAPSMTFCVLMPRGGSISTLTTNFLRSMPEQAGFGRRGRSGGGGRRGLEDAHFGARRQALGRLARGKALAHGADVRRRRAAAAADQARAELQRARRELGEVFGRREVDVAALDELRQPGVRHRRDGRAARGGHHLLEHLEARLRADAAVDAHHVGARLRAARRPPRRACVRTASCRRARTSSAR